MQGVGYGRAIPAMLLAVGAVPILENEMHRTVDTVAHAIESADRRLRANHGARVEDGDRGAEELELAGHVDADRGAGEAEFYSNSATSDSNLRGVTLANAAPRGLFSQFATRISQDIL